MCRPVKAKNFCGLLLFLENFIRRNEMTVRFTAHCLVRMRERFKEVSDVRQLLQVIERRLTVCDPNFAMFQRERITGTCCYRKITAIISQVQPSAFLVIIVM